jgi:hypothetical protein
LLPVIFAITGYYISNRFAVIVKQQARKIKKEAGRTQMVLSFIENLRQDKLDEPFSSQEKKRYADQSLAEVARIYG